MTNDEIKDISPKLRRKIVDVIRDGVFNAVDCPIKAMGILVSIMAGFDKADPEPDPVTSEAEAEPTSYEEEANLDG